MKNKILSVILILVMMLPVHFAFADETDSEVSFETKVMRGLFVVDTDFETNPEDELSRGDFVRILMDMIGAPEENKLTVSGFTDLSKSASYSKAVIHAANAGYVSGYEDGTFRADNPITAAEAVTMILKVAGYDMAAVQGGGYVNGYLSLANEQKLLRGVSKSTAAPLSKEDVAVILYNTLSVEVYSIGDMTADGKISIERNGELFMEARMDMKKYRGVVTSTYMTSLTGEAKCVKGEIAIDDVVFDNNYEKAEEYLGYRVEAYAKIEGNGDETLVFAIPYKTNTTELKSEDITENTTNTVVYYELDDDTKTKRINVEPDADKILNGNSEAYLSLPELVSISDRMIFIDNDDDGDAEVVIIYAYDEMYVGSVSAMDEIIYSKYTYDGVLSNIELEDVDELYITKDGVAVGINDIKPDNVISIIKTETNNKTIVRIDVSDKKITGTVTKIEPDEETIYIDNEEYKLSDLYYEALGKGDYYAKEIELGMAATFYLNPFGRIAAFSVDSTSKQYGYVKKAYINDQGLDLSVEFKILGTDGDWQIYGSQEKIRLNGERINTENIFTYIGSTADGASIINPQLIEFELDKNSKIKSINTAELSNDYKTDKFRYKVLSQQIYRSANQSFDSKVYISGNTVTFSIPATYRADGTVKKYTPQELSILPDKYFITNNGPIYRDWSAYDVNAYNCDKFGLTDLIVMETVLEDVGQLNASDFLFNQLTYSASSDNTAQMTIEGLHGTNIAASAPVDDNVLVYDETGTLRDISYLECGDLLKLYLDVDNNVYRIDVVYKAAMRTQSNYEGSLHANEVLIAGTVTDIDAQSGFVIINDGAAENKSIRLYTNKISVYMFDSKDKRNPITVASINDIQSGNFILMKGGQSNFSYIVIYK